MEKFTKWEDKSNGINPFVPIKASRAKGEGILHMFSRLFLAVLLPFRLVLFGLLLLLTLAADGLSYFLPLALLRRFFKRIIVAPLSRLVLFSLGYWAIHEDIPNYRRLRLGKRIDSDVLNRFRFGTVNAGEVVVSTCTNFAEVLYLSYRFSPEFAVVALPSGEKVIPVGLFGALCRATCSYRNPSQRITERKGVSVNEAAELAKKRARASMVVFAEGVRSNGASVLEFTQCLDVTPQPLTHLVGFKYVFNRFSPCHTVQGLLWYLVGCFMQAYHVMEVSFIPEELYGVKGEMEGKRSEELRRVVALGIGDRGVKTVGLSISDYFSFIDYYSSHSKKQR